MMREVPWQTGEICGPDSARGIKNVTAIERDLKKAKKPVLIVGSEALTEKYGRGTMVDYMIELSKTKNIPIIATAHTIKAFIEKGHENVSQMGAMELPLFLQDAEWNGPKGNGPFDLILVYGIPYYMQWTLLSAVMNFAPHITAITLGRHYQPHAKWSFPNMKVKKWQEALKEILTMMGGGT